MSKPIELSPSINHHSDLEDMREGQVSIPDVFRSIFYNPMQIIRRWNWKIAVIGATVRASFYLVNYLVSREVWTVVLTAVLMEMTFRFITSGFFGSLTQSFRRATPAWLATVNVMLVFPLLSHIVEFVTHFAREKWFSDLFPAAINEDSRRRSFAISVLFSFVSALFSIFMMRNGVLLVGAGKETKTLRDDFRSMPMLIGRFIVYLPNQIFLLFMRGEFLSAVGLFAFFGFAVGGILGSTRGKWTWAINSAMGAWGTLLFAVLLCAIAAVVGHYRKRQDNTEQ